MKAVLKRGPGPGLMDMAAVDRPVPGPGQALLRVSAAGICGTDVAIWQWKEAVVGQYGASFPLIPGHEMAGTVVESAGGSVATGTVVAINPNLSCRRCEHCFAGRDTLCLTRGFLGGSHNGGWAEYVTVPETSLQVLPEGTDPAVAPLMEPLAVAAHSVLERVPPEPGDLVVVNGAGPIGLLTAVLARDAGAGAVVVTGLSRDAERLRLAEELGAVAVEVEQTDPVAAVRALQADGADVVYETSGASTGLRQAVDMVRRAGRISLIGLAGAPSELLTAPIVLREVSVLGARGYNETTWVKLLRVVPRVQHDVLRVVSHRLPLEEYETALELTTTQQANKVLLVP